MHPIHSLPFPELASDLDSRDPVMNTKKVDFLLLPVVSILIQNGAYTVANLLISLENNDKVKICTENVMFFNTLVRGGTRARSL